MKIIETGTTYKIYGEDLIVLENLPAQTYKVGFSKFTGFFLEKQANLEIKEEKIYGVHESKVRKVLNRFKNTNKKKNFYDITIEDFSLTNYAARKPQLSFDLGV